MRKIIVIILFCLSVIPLFAQTQPQILSFTYDEIPLAYDEVEQGIATAVFSWEAINVTDAYQMQMHALVGGQWALIGEGFEATKQDTLVIAHPLSLGVPTYRLSIVDSNHKEVESAFLYLSYATLDPDGIAEITQFASTQASVSRQALSNGQVFVPVKWEVMNRAFNTNLVFEQVMPDGTWRPIALPHFEAWVRSVGDGVVVPVYVADADITIQTRLVDVLTDETISISQITIPISENTPPQTAMPSQTATPTPMAEPIQNQIDFSASDLVTLGSPIMLRWDASAAQNVADTVVIREWHQVSFTGVYGEIPIYFEDPTNVPAHEWTMQPLSGEMTIDAPTAFPQNFETPRDNLHVVVLVMYLYHNGEPYLENGEPVRVAQTVYLRTVEDATSCEPSIQLPEQVDMDVSFNIAWDLCGVPSVNIQYTNNNDVYVWGLHPRFTPGNPGNHDFSVSLFSDQPEHDITFTITDPFGSAQVQGTVKVVRP